MKLVQTIDCGQGAVRAVRYNVDGNYCITCGSDKSLKLWNPLRGLLLKTYTGHGNEPLDADGSCDNATIVSCGADRSAVVWDVMTGKPRQKFRDHAAAVNTVRFNEEATLVFTGAQDGRVRAWDCRSRARDPLQTLDEATDSISCVAVSDHEILSGSSDGRVRRYDLRQGKMHEDFVGKPVTSVKFTNDGQCMLVSSLDSTVRLLDKDKGEMLTSYTGHTNTVYRIDSALDHTDAKVISGSENAKVYIWDLVEMTTLDTLNHPTRSAVHSVSAHPKQPYLLTASANSVFLWGNDE